MSIQPPASGPARLSWRDLRPAAILCGIGAGLISLVLILISPIAFAAAGSYAVTLYRRRTHLPLSAGVGARIGSLTGLIGALFFSAVFAITTTVDVLYFNGGPGMHKTFEEAAASSGNPETQRQMLQLVNSPGGIPLIVGLGLLVCSLAFVLFAAAGGAFQGSRKPAAPPE